jgi:hypothetical protein
MIDPLYIALPVAGGFIGFFACALFTAGKVAGLDTDIQDCCEDYARVATGNHELRGAHTRVTDALAAKNARIATLTELARSQNSVRSGRIIDVLEG